MSNFVQFVPRADRNAKANLDEFIRMARDELTAFGAGGAWGGDRWQLGRTVVVFATGTAPLGAYSFMPMAEPFKQFAKAYIRYKFSHQPVIKLMVPMQALRCVEAALIECCGRADIALLSGAVMDVSAQKCREFFVSEDTWHKTGLVLQQVFDFCRTSYFVQSLPQWKSPFKKQAILTEELGEKGQAHRDAKLPSNATMLLLADLFATAEDTETRYFTSMLVLLMVAPSRISEALTLPTECIAWEEDDRGKRQMYLRWSAAKGKGPMKKWVIPAMHSVVEEAIRRLVEIGEPARAAARYAFDNPDKFMRHSQCVTDPNLSEDHPLTQGEFSAAMGIKLYGSSGEADVAKWSNVLSRLKWTRKLCSNEKATYRTLAEHVRQTYSGDDWPFIHPAKTVRAWEALCLHRENEFHPEFAVKEFSWRLPSGNEVNLRFKNSKGPSLFERKGMRNPDGSSIKLTTHQLRHWLSTMSERAGMDDYTLAQWAGRADCKHNRHYDHRTPEEQLEVAREVILGEKPNLLERFKNRQPVTYMELGEDRLGTAKATLYGMCTHDYAMAPCQKQRECMTCKEHVCIKGDHVTLDRIKVLEDQTAILLDRAERANEDGIFGANRWVDNHKWKLAHVKAMRMTLERTDVPEGSIVRIPQGHDPSAVQRAMMDIGLMTAPSSEIIALPLVSKALPGAGDA